MLDKRFTIVILCMLLCIFSLYAQMLIIPGNKIADGQYYLSLIETGTENNQAWNIFSEYLDTYVESVNGDLFFKKLTGESADISLIKMGLNDEMLDSGYIFNGFTEGSMRSGYPGISVLDDSIVIDYDRQSGLGHTQYIVVYTRGEYKTPQINITIPTANYVNMTDKKILIYENADNQSKKIGDIPIWKDNYFKIFLEKGIGPYDYQEMQKYYKDIDRTELQTVTVYEQSIGIDKINKSEIWYKIKYNEIEGYVYFNVFTLLHEDQYWDLLSLNLFGL